MWQKSPWNNGVKACVLCGPGVSEGLHGDAEEWQMDCRCRDLCVSGGKRRLVRQVTGYTGTEIYHLVYCGVRVAHSFRTIEALSL